MRKRDRKGWVRDDGGAMERRDRELDLEQKREAKKDGEGWHLQGEEKTSVPCVRVWCMCVCVCVCVLVCERLSLDFIRDADNTRFRRELRDSCFIREGKRRCAPCIEFQCFPGVDGKATFGWFDNSGVVVLAVGKFEFPLTKDKAPPCRNMRIV